MLNCNKTKLLVRLVAALPKVPFPRNQARLPRAPATLKLTHQVIVFLLLVVLMGVPMEVKLFR
jgi:hypothetical protein